uniref:glutathione transferase n=1 Tax=Ursus americanus TaxID=9643 RepID=A0A452QTU8_URSAM
MAGKPKLHYFNGRGRMESIRWLLAAAGVEFEEIFIETPEDLNKLKNDGYLLFQQVPMVEMDGMKIVQTRAILNYIATKYNLYGKDIKERALLMNYEAGKMVGSSLQILRLLDTSQQLETKDNVSEYVADKAREQKGPKELVLKVHKSQEC